jgi:prophage DNA circulation protein
MSWRDLTGTASFREVEFFISDTEVEGGRRIVGHEYPKKEVSFSEDLGRQSKELNISGYVVGPEYISARDELIDALEKIGPGELHHPFYGRLNVVCTKFKISESDRAGGTAVFDISFRESSLPDSPSYKISAVSQVLSVADTVRTALRIFFSGKYSPGVIMDSIENGVRSVTLQMDNVKSFETMSISQVAAFANRLDRLKNSISTIILIPENVFDEINNLFGDVLSLEAVVSAHYFNLGNAPDPITTNRQVELDNFNAFVSLFKVSALIRAAEIAVDSDYDSYDAAVLVQKQIVEMIDAQEGTDDVILSESLRQLCASVVRAIPDESVDLPRLIYYSPSISIPSLVLAQQLYGDISNEQDIIVRNNPAKPGFLNRPLRVLSYG